MGRPSAAHAALVASAVLAGPALEQNGTVRRFGGDKTGAMTAPHGRTRRFPDRQALSGQVTWPVRPALFSPDRRHDNGQA